MVSALLKSVAAATVLSLSFSASAATVTVNPAATWNGYMNVFNLPSAGGGFQFGQPWGTADLCASFSGPVLTLSPNTIGDPNSYWYSPSGGPGAVGQKLMDANMYVEDNSGALSGQALTFEGTVLSSTMFSTHPTEAFIKDFAPDFSSFNVTTVPLSSVGNFSITLNTDPGAGRHVQYGFETKGANVWFTDVTPFGNLQVTAVPEPTSLGLLAVGAGMLIRRRRA